MIEFLHNFHPNSLMFSVWGVEIYWYGLFVVLGIIATIVTGIILGYYYNINKDKIVDLTFWLIIGGIFGARIYHIFLELPYYLNNPEDIAKIWQGGLAIHGAIIAAVIIIWLFAKKNNIGFWKLSSIAVTGAALGQAIGRWGNYFNQELFGKPTDLPWSIPINIASRPMEYITSNYFHPTFLYESLGNLLIFAILISAHVYIIKKQKIKKINFLYITFSYLALYSILRFSLEFIRIDRTPEFLGLRFPQIASLIILIILITLVGLIQAKKINLDKKQ